MSRRYGRWREMMDTRLFDHTILKADATKEAVQKICNEAKEYGFIVINGFDFFFDPNKEEDRNKYALDGLHLNNEGHKLLADFIISTGVLQ